MAKTRALGMKRSTTELMGRITPDSPDDRWFVLAEGMSGSSHLGRGSENRSDLATLDIPSADVKAARVVRSSHAHTPVDRDPARRRRRAFARRAQSGVTSLARPTVDPRREPPWASSAPHSVPPVDRRGAPPGSSTPRRRPPGRRHPGLECARAVRAAPAPLPQAPRVRRPRLGLRHQRRRHDRATSIGWPSGSSSWSGERLPGVAGRLEPRRRGRPGGGPPPPRRRTPGDHLRHAGGRADLHHGRAGLQPRPGPGRASARRVGSTRADPIPVPLTVLFSRRDGIVAWPACIDHTSPGAEHVEIASTHLGMGVDPDVWAIVADRLARAGTAQE